VFGRRNIFGILLLAFLGACSKEPPREAYFGGMIKNPVSEYVLLYRNYIPVGPVDTFRLDAKGRFGHKINIDSADMYFFLHGEETNMCFIRPGDSLLVYSNSMSFDNSMQFSGEGGEFNNLLHKISLISVDEIGLMTHLVYQSDKQMLLSYINQYHVTKQNEIQRFLDKCPDDFEFTPKEELVLNYSIYFPDYYLLEGYNTLHPHDTISYTIPFRFSLDETYHPVHYFLSAYLFAYMDRRLNLPDSLTPQACISLAREVDRRIKDTISREFLKFQLITNNLSAQTPQPSYQQIIDILNVFPSIFIHGDVFAHEYIRLYQMHHRHRKDLSEIVK